MVIYTVNHLLKVIKGMEYRIMLNKGSTLHKDFSL